MIFFTTGNNRLACLQYIIVNAILLLLFFLTSTKETWILIAGCIALCHIILSYLVINASGIKPLSIPVLFITVTFILHYGQFLVSIIPDYDFYKYDFIKMYDYYTSSIAFYKTYIITTMVTAGIIFGLNKYIFFTSKNSYYNHQIFKYGLIITLILLPLRLYIDYKRIMIGLASGYVESLLSLGVPNILLTISRFVILGCSLMFFGFEPGSSKKKKIYILFVMYLLLIMVSGSRLASMVDIIVLSLAYFYNENLRLSIKTILKVCIALICLSAIMATVRAFRTSELGNGNSGSTASEIFVKKIYTENILLQELEEMGQTFYTCSAAVDFVKTEGYWNGRSYYKGIFTVLPNIGNIANEYENESTYTTSMQAIGLRGAYQHIGGSYIGEMIVNFQYIFPVFAFILGLLISKLNNKMHYYRGDYRIIYILCIFMGCIEWARETFPVGARFTFWGCMLIWLIDIIAKPQRHV